MWIKGLNLLIGLILLTGCFQPRADQSRQVVDPFSGKNDFILNAKQIIELNDESDDQVDDEPDEPVDEKFDDQDDDDLDEPVNEEPDSLDNEDPIPNYTAQQKADKHFTGVEAETGLYIVDNPESMQVYVNKNRRLPVGYSPNNLVEPEVSHLKPEGDLRRLLVKDAAHALEDLFAAANEEDIALAAVSGYRSNQLQSTIFQGHVSSRGLEHAVRFSARPGTSEHETGLAMDVSAASVAFALSQSFSDTDEGSWLADHAAQFGFIIRYPKGKESVTGYAYEPWHLRYVGTELAQHLDQHSLTLEEYFGYHY